MWKADQHHSWKRYEWFRILTLQLENRWGRVDAFKYAWLVPCRRRVVGGLIKWRTLVLFALIYLLKAFIKRKAAVVCLLTWHEINYWSRANKPATAAWSNKQEQRLLTGETICKKNRHKKIWALPVKKFFFEILPLTCWFMCKNKFIPISICFCVIAL